jgi:hydroxymethylglutaryl-CoA reductase (NADPH)
MFIPAAMLRQLYTVGSLKNTEAGVQFSVKNRLSDAHLTSLRSVRINGRDVPLERVRIVRNGGEPCAASAITTDSPLWFPLRQSLDIVACNGALPQGKHEIEVTFTSKPFGKLAVTVADTVSETVEAPLTIPRDDTDDYCDNVVQARQHFVEEFSGVSVEHVKKFSFDAHAARGNCENFAGVAQVPLGFMGPIQINGEHANGQFIIPFATTEGTLIASYNRGMKVLNESGGVKCTVVDDAMQRAPVFVFDDAREGREFSAWVQANLASIGTAAEATSSVAKLQSIEPYLANKFVFLRFNFSTGDAAGQNMVTKATLAACSWIVERYDGIRRFFLEANTATDKKASALNTLRTRGKRVTAEALIKRDVLINRMRVEPEALAYHYQVANIGSIMAGANNNGLHSANAIAAMFIATGQDVANVAESSAGIIYTEVTPEGDLYISITIPSLIVATHGGGTGLPTQKECLQLLGCHGKGGVRKFAEIVAGTVLAGELSLAAAISSLDWVDSHEKYGRHR